MQITTQSIANIVTAATNTWTGVQTFPAPGASKGSIVLTPGTVSGTPANGSLWTTSGGLFVQTSGAAHQLADLDANTFTGEQSFAASTTANAGVNLGQGSAPTSPVNGDLWITSAGLFARANGATVGPFISSGTFASLGANTFTGEQSLPASTVSTAGLNLGQGAAPNTPVNGDLWITASGVFARVNGTTASLGVTVPTAAAGGSNTQVQYNCSSVLCGATGFAYTGGASDTLTGPDGTTWATTGISIGSSTKLNIGATILMGGTAGAIWLPSCSSGAGGATWLIGPTAGYCTNTTSAATDNICIGTITCGSTSSTITSAFGNVMAGSENARNLTTGNNNTGVGFEAEHLVTTGTGNTGIGSTALSSVTTGANNTAIGANAGAGITTGSLNVCIAASCGAIGTLTGSHNVMIGGASTTITSGDHNVLIGPTGASSGQGIVAGNGNIWIGGQNGSLTDQNDSITICDGENPCNILEQYLGANGYLRINKPLRVVVGGGAFLGLTPTTVSALATADASPSDGDSAYVTDASACTFSSAVTGGGSVHCRVHYDSSSASWKAG